MPKISQQVQQHENLAAQNKVSPADVAPIAQSIEPIYPALPAGSGSAGPVRGTYQPNQILGTDFSRATATSALNRSPVFPFTPVTPVTKNITTISESSSGGSTSSLELEINGVPNPNQKVFNIVPSGLQVTADAAGNVSFISTSTGDGLIHGDSIWEIDPAYICWRENFSFSMTSPNAGDIAWSYSGLDTTQNKGNFAPPYLGALGMFNNFNTTANAFGYLYPSYIAALSANPATNPAWPLFDYPAWKCIWVFKMDDYPGLTGRSSPFPLAQKSFYIGWRAWDTAPPASRTGQNSRPYCFTGLRFDSTAGIADTTFHFESVANAMVSSPSGARNNTQGKVVDTGIAPTRNTWYRLEMLCTTAGSIQMTLYDGGTPFTSALAIASYSFTGATVTFSTNNDIQCTLTAASTSNLNCAGEGAIINISHWSGGTIGSAFTETAQWYNDGTIYFNDSRNLGSTSAQTTAIFNFNPPVYPFATYGNSAGSISGDGTVCYFNFFGFVWNPGVGGGTGTPNTNKPRYF